MERVNDFWVCGYFLGGHPARKAGKRMLVFIYFFHLIGTGPLGQTGVEGQSSLLTIDKFKVHILHLA